MKPSPQYAVKFVNTRLSYYNHTIRSAMVQYLPKKEPYEYLYALLREYPERGGKMFRPALCLATARCLGVPEHVAIRSAVSIELLHNATLIHDDIQDGSKKRRKLDTLHEIHNIPLAINAGDMMAACAIAPIIDDRFYIGSSASKLVSSLFYSCMRELGEGQAMELGWQKTNKYDINESEYLTMVFKKSCWLGMILPLLVGATLSKRFASNPKTMIKLGFYTGAAFQIQDDLLNLDEDSDSGKDLYGDIREGKRTLITIHLRQHCTKQERQKIDHILSLDQEKTTDFHINTLLELISRYGSVEHAKCAAESFSEAAEKLFIHAFSQVPDSPDKLFIKYITRWVSTRRK